MAIFEDITKALTTVFCTECPHWYGAAETPEAGKKLAADHEANVHADSWDVRRQVAKNERRRLQRHAEETIDAPIGDQSLSRGITRKTRPRQAH